MQYNPLITRNDINISAIVVPCHRIRELAAREIVGKLYHSSCQKVTNSFKYHFNYDQVIEKVQFNIQWRIKKIKKHLLMTTPPTAPSTLRHFATPPLRRFATSTFTWSATSWTLSSTNPTYNVKTKFTKYLYENIFKRRTLFLPFNTTLKGEFKWLESDSTIPIAICTALTVFSSTVGGPTENVTILLEVYPTRNSDLDTTRLIFQIHWYACYGSGFPKQK